MKDDTLDVGLNVGLPQMGPALTSVELTGLVSLLRNALLRIAEAVGDVDGSNDSNSLLKYHPSLIVNIARSIGSMADIEPPLGGISAVPEEPALGYALKDATYNVIPNPNQLYRADAGGHRLCELGCIYDAGNTCTKGYGKYSEATKTYSGNYKGRHGRITFVEDYYGVCQNTSCPGWSGKPRSESDPCGASDLKVRRYRVVLPKESRIVYDVETVYHDDLGNQYNQRHWWDPEDGQTHEDPDPAESYGYHDTRILLRFGDPDGSPDYRFPIEAGDTYQIVLEFPPGDRTVGIWVNTGESPSEGTWTKLDTLDTSGETNVRVHYELPDTESGVYWIRAYWESGTDTGVAMTQAWLTRVFRTYHRNYGKKLLLPKSFEDIAVGQQYPSGLVHIYGVVNSERLNAEGFYALSTFQVDPLESMELRIVSTEEPPLGDTNYVVIVPGCSLSQMLKALLEAIINHSSNSDIHLDRKALCKLLREPEGICCDDYPELALRVQYAPFSCEIEANPNQDVYVKDSTVHFSAIVRGAPPSPNLNITWWHYTPTKETYLGAGSSIAYTCDTEGPLWIKLKVEDNTNGRVDDCGDPLTVEADYISHVMPVGPTDPCSSLNLTNNLDSLSDTYPVGNSISVTATFDGVGASAWTCTIAAHCWTTGATSTKTFSNPTLTDTLTVNLTDGGRWRIGVSWSLTIPGGSCSIVEHKEVYVTGDTSFFYSEGGSADQVITVYSREVSGSSQPDDPTTWVNDAYSQVAYTQDITAGVGLYQSGGKLYPVEFRSNFVVDVGRVGDSPGTLDYVIDQIMGGTKKLSSAQLIMHVKGVVSTEKYAWNVAGSEHASKLYVRVGAYLAYIYDFGWCLPFMHTLTCPSGPPLPDFSRLVLWDNDPGWMYLAGRSSETSYFDWVKGCQGDASTGGFPCRFPDQCCGTSTPGFGCDSYTHPYGSGGCRDGWCQAQQFGNIAYNMFYGYDGDNPNPYAGTGFIDENDTEPLRGERLTGYGGDYDEEEKYFFELGAPTSEFPDGKPQMVVADVTRHLQVLLDRDVLSGINHACYTGGVPDPKRLKIGFHLIPAWSLDLTELNSHVTYTGGKWTFDSGYKAEDFNRFVKFCTSRDSNSGHKARKPYLLIVLEDV